MSESEEDRKKREDEYLTEHDKKKEKDREAAVRFAKLFQQPPIHLRPRI